MDPNTLHSAMGAVMPLDYYASITDQCNAVMFRGGMTTVRRCQYFLAQVREESVGLKYTQEIGSDSYLRGQPYHPYVGRTFIQVTWQSNYAKVGRWMNSLGLIGDPDVFVNNPGLLASPKWAWWGALWYWQEHNLNRYADAGDFRGLTIAINGGLNGWDSRRQYLAEIETLGDAVRPTPTGPHSTASAATAVLTPPEGVTIVDPATKAYLDGQFADVDKQFATVAQGMGLLLHGDSTHPNNIDAIAAKVNALAAAVAALKAVK